MRQVITAMAAAAATLVLIVGISFAGHRFISPMLSEDSQSYWRWLGGTAFAVLAVLAAIAQVTGFSLRDFLFPPEQVTHSPDNHQHSAALNVYADGTSDWQGDILQQGSTKIVFDSDRGNQSDTSSRKVENLISDIQTDLYGENSRLPYVLMLCLDLCDWVDLSGKYERWLRKDLDGYSNFQEPQNEFDVESEYDAWMEAWASHRTVATHIEVEYSPRELRSAETDELPFIPVVIGSPIAQIARDLRNARAKGRQKHSIAMRRLGPTYLDQLTAAVREAPWEMTVPPDLLVYYSVSDLEKILTEVRARVRLLIKDARQKLVSSP